MVSYVSGDSALSIGSKNLTTGNWRIPNINETDYRHSDDLRGINYFEQIKINGTTYTNLYVANHYRALADLFKEYVNTKKIIFLRGSVGDYIDGNKDELLSYIGALSITDELSNKVCIREFELKVVKKWTSINIK